MMNNRVLLDDVAEGGNDALFAYLQSGGDANLVDNEWNCPIIFHAVLGGNIDAVRKLIEFGADVNLTALEPGCDMLAETVLSLAMQCRHLQGSKKFDVIVELLEQNGAKDEA
jgi:ankyrin repeat protein